MITLKNETLLSVIEESDTTVGGNQYWFPARGFIPQGACGATAAANMFAYLLRSRSELLAKATDAGVLGLKAASEGATLKKDYLAFMKQIYQYLYPRPGGLMAEPFTQSADEFAAAYGFGDAVRAERVKIPIVRAKRPTYEECKAFLSASLENDIPVAFLILSNGCVANLDTWHWVTILALDIDGKRIKITDNGKVFWADLARWLDTSIMGGSFVRLLA